MPNEEMIRHWNEQSGPRWVRLHPRLDAQIASLWKPLLDEVGEGEAVLDVGCGCATTTLEIAERVGPEGHVTGIDVARPMLEHAEHRAREQGAGNIRFVEADAQIHALPDQTFDRVFSRFGVMFFEDPVAAFSNVRRSMRRGARLGFICWQGMEKNDWMRVPFAAIKDCIDVPPPPAPGSPGPFAFGDRNRLLEILSGAGFSGVEIESQERPVTIGGLRGLDEAVEFTQSMGMIASLLEKAGPAVAPRVRSALRSAYEQHHTPEGVQLASASWLVRAQA